MKKLSLVVQECFNTCNRSARSGSPTSAWSSVGFHANGNTHTHARRHANAHTHTHGRPCAFVFRLAKPRRRRGAAPKGETAIYPRVNGLNWKGRGTLKSLRLGPKSLHRRLRKRHLVYTKRKTRDPHPRAPPFSKH